MSSIRDYQATPLEEAYTSYLLETVFDLDGSVTEIKISGREAVTFLSKSGVHRLILRNLWTTVDPQSVGSLMYRHQFSTLLRCVALAQYPKKDTLLDQALQAAYHQQLSPTAAIRSCLQSTAQRTDIPLAGFDGIPLPDKATLKPYLKEEEDDDEDETDMDADDFGDFSAATPPTATHTGQIQQPQTGWGAFGGSGANTLSVQQQTSLPQKMGGTMSLQQPQTMPSMNFLPQQQQMSNIGRTAQPFQMQKQQEQQPQSMQQSSMGLISQQPTPPVSQPRSDWGAFCTPAVSQPPQPSVVMTNSSNDEFGGFTSATPSSMQSDPFGAAVQPVTPAEPSGWDALDALAASTPMVPPPTLPDASSAPSTDQLSAEVENENSLPNPTVTTQIQPTVSDNNDDFGDFASSTSAPLQESSDPQQLAVQPYAWDSMDVLAATTSEPAPLALPNRSSAEEKDDDFGAVASFSSEIPNAEPQQNQSSAGDANVTPSFPGEESQALPSAGGSFEGLSKSSQPAPFQETSGWNALDALADPTPPPPILPDPISVPPVGEDTVATPVTNDADDFGNFASPVSEQQQAASSGWDALDALAGSTELPPPTLAALPNPISDSTGHALPSVSQENMIDGTTTSNTLDVQTSNLQIGGTPSVPVRGDTTNAQEAPGDVLQVAGATTKQRGNDFGDFTSADSVEASLDITTAPFSGFDAFNTVASASPAFEGVTTVDEDFGGFESTSGVVQNQTSSDSQLFPVQNASENFDSALPVTDVCNGAPKIPEKTAMSALRSDSAFYSARASSVQSEVSSLDDFVDAVQGDSDQPAPGLSEMNKNFPNSENIAGEPIGMSADDPFSAFETLAPSQPELPPLSYFDNIDSIESSPLDQAALSDEAQDEILVGSTEGKGQEPTRENKHHEEFDESFGDFEGISAETGEAVPVESGLPSKTLAPSSDQFVNFGGSATEAPATALHSQPASGESLAKDEIVEANFFGSSVSPQVQETSSTAPEEVDMFQNMATSNSDDKKDEFDAFETVGSGIISHNVSEEQDSPAQAADEMDDFGDFGTAPTAGTFSSDFNSTRAAPIPVDDFRDFDPVPAAATPFDDFGAFDSAHPASQASDDFGTFDSATPPALATVSEDNFGNFDSAPAKSEPANDFGAFDAASETPMPVDDFGDFAGFGTNETDAVQSNSEERSSDGRMAEFDAVPTRNALSDDEDDWDAFKEAIQTQTPTKVDPQTKTLLEARDAILATAAHVPENLMQCLGTSASHVDFENCFEANIGVEVPVSPDRQQRMERCQRIVQMLSSARSKLAAAYWTAALATAKDELSCAVSFCNEANSLNKNERRLVEQRFGTYLSGLGEIVRVVRMIVATMGDMLMLDPSSLFTVDTFASSWCSLAILKDALAIESMWKSITDEASKFGFTKSALPAIATISELRALSSSTTTSAPDQLCQFTLQPFVQGSKTTVQVKWGGRCFMACAANFLANKCAFFSCED